MEDLKKLIDQDPMTAAKHLQKLSETDEELRDYLDAWHMDWFEQDAPHATKSVLIENWFERDEADDTEKWEAIETWAEFTPGGREIIRLTAKEICPELFIRPQVETGDTTLTDTYRTELLQKIADNNSTQELEKLAGI